MLYFRVEVVAQLEERMHPAPQIRGSKPVIVNIYSEHM